MGKAISKLATRRGPGEVALADYFAQMGWVAQQPVTVNDNGKPRTFYPDFADPAQRLYAECDGSPHKWFNQPKDQARDALIEAEGWRGIRIWNREAQEHQDLVHTRIGALIAEHGIGVA